MPNDDIEEIDAAFCCFSPCVRPGVSGWLRDPDRAQIGAVAALRPERGSILAVEFAGRRALRRVRTLARTEWRLAHGERPRGVGLSRSIHPRFRRRRSGKTAG